MLSFSKVQVMRPDSFAELLSAYNGPEAALAEFLFAMQRQRLKLIEEVMRLRECSYADRPRMLIRILTNWLRLRRLSARLIEYLVDHSDDSLAERRDFYRSLVKYSAATIEIY